MPRKKISIEQAFQVLEEAGIQIQVKSVKEQPTSVAPVQHPNIFKNTQPDKTILQKVNTTTVKVRLFAKHSIGNGGNLVAGENGKQVENSGVQVYGPGVCDVPKYLLESLLYADAQARVADERMLEREQRSYLITQRISGVGQRANIGIRVPDGTLDSLGDLPYESMYRI